ncbi:MAG: serine/threonine protein kinase [Gemmataceae bacterium]|nr:serine/threonine protein kinase [Gemmataceae bacterium]
MSSQTSQLRQLGFLGRGGTAEAFLVQSEDVSREPFVLKQIRSDKKGQPEILASFQLEAKTLSKLDHPNIVKYLGGEIDKGILYLEYVSGLSADQLLKKLGRFPVERAIPLILDLCAALDHAHHRGIIHGDLKPANLVVSYPNTPKEYLKLVDFGFARIDSTPNFGLERLQNPQQVRAKGTPLYIAPEILQGQTIDGRADLYSVGVILFEFLAGVPPFAESDLEELLAAHIKKDPPQFTTFNIWDIPFEVEAICQRCLSKYPAERFSSVRELGYALADLAGIEWNPDPLGNAETATMLSVVEAPSSNELVYSMEAWMPEPIAVVKLNGFLTDTNCRLRESQLGRILAEYPVKKQTGLLSRLLGKGQDESIQMEIRLRKPRLNEQLLDIRVKFTAPRQMKNSLKEFEAIVKELFQQMKSFLISRN